MTTWTGPAGEYIAVLSDANKKLAGHARLIQEQYDELLAAQYIVAQGAAQLAIEKCKNATGYRSAIDAFVSANQCAEEIIDAITKAKGCAA